MRASLLVVLIGAGLALFAACGGDSESSSEHHATGGAAGAGGGAGSSAVTAGAGGEAEPFTGNLPPDTVLGGLSDAEYQAYCNQAAAYIVQQNQDTLCRVLGQTQSGAQGVSCEMLYGMCLLAPPQTILAMAPVVDCTKPPDCNATAGQMDACVTGLGSALPESQTPPCGEGGAAASLPEIGAGNLPLDCVPAMAACPGFLTGTPGAGGAGGAPPVVVGGAGGAPGSAGSGGA